MDTQRPTHRHKGLDLKGPSISHTTIQSREEHRRAERPDLSPWKQEEHSRTPKKPWKPEESQGTTQNIRESQRTLWKPWQLTETDRIPQNTIEPDRTFWNIKEPEGIRN